MFILRYIVRHTKYLTGMYIVYFLYNSLVICDLIVLRCTQVASLIIEENIVNFTLPFHVTI